MVSVESIIISVANIGAIGYLVKRVLEKVDRHGDILPQMLATQEAIAKSLASVDANQTRLWESRDDHDKRLVKIETVHDFHGCNQRIVK